MALGFSDLLESVEDASEEYDRSYSLLATSDDIEYAESESIRHDSSCSFFLILLHRGD